MQAWRILRQIIEHPPVRTISFAGPATRCAVLSAILRTVPALTRPAAAEPGRCKAAERAGRAEHAAVCPGGPVATARPDGAAEIPK